MLELRQITTLQEAMSWYQGRGSALLGNEFEIVITNPVKKGYVTTEDITGRLTYHASENLVGAKTQDRGQLMHITSLNIPPLGLSMSMPDKLGYILQTPNITPLGFSYVLPNSMVQFDPFLGLYKAQYTNAGIPKFIPVSDRPSILLRTVALSTSPSVELAKFIGCKFSYPVYQVSLEGNSAAVFSVQVSYFNYEINIK